MDKKQFSKIGLSFFIGTLIMYGTSFLLGLLSASIPSVTQNMDLFFIIQSIPTYFISFPVIFLLLKKVPVTQSKERKKMGFGKLLIAIIMCIAITYLCNFLGTFITYLIGLIKHGNVANVLADATSLVSPAAIFLVIVVCAPIMEELLFRKALMDRTAKYGEGVSILLSALMFGLFHGNLNQFAYAFCLGCFFAFIYSKTRNIKYTIILHMTVNFIGSFLSTLVSRSDFFKMASDGTLTSLTETELITLVTENIVEIFGFYGFAFIVYGGIIAGAILLIVMRKKFTLNAGEVTIEKGQRFKTMICNVGMILFCIIWIAAMILQLIQ